MAYKQILYEKDDSIARVTMNRPRYRNALSRVLLEELDDAFAAAVADDDVRVIKLSVNQAQDAMGFRTAVKGAHSSYMLMEIAGQVRPRADEEADRRVLSRVERALEKLRRGERAKERVRRQRPDTA